MSRTILYKVNKSGDAERYREYSNAFRSAWLVWDTMSKKYLGQAAIEFTLHSKDDNALQAV